jgi:hypothetical protein
MYTSEGREITIKHRGNELKTPALSQNRFGIPSEIARIGSNRVEGGAIGEDRDVVVGGELHG